MNKKIKTYHDGYLFVYKDITENSTFGAKKNIESLENLDLVFKLGYKESYRRLQDYEFAENSGRELTLKIKTRLIKGIKNEYKVVIFNRLYDIIQIDYDRSNREMYLYLEFVKELWEMRDY